MALDSRFSAANLFSDGYSDTLGDHWASDVLGAYLIGGMLLGIALRIYMKLKDPGIIETKRTRPERSDAFRSFNPE